MSQLKIILFLFLLCGVSARAQNKPDAAQQESIEQKFRAFDYDAVIDLANQALVHAGDYTPEILFQIYEMKAVSHYSKMEMTASLNSFVEILKIDPQHKLDPAKYSPKIVAFFDEIKQSFLRSVEPISQPTTQDAAQPDTVIVYRIDNSFPKIIYPSLLAPGSGHWLGGHKQKGMILTGASTILLASSIYYTLDCRQKEKDYLNAVAQNDIDSKYALYNSSYKTRNALWSAYALVWIYSQVDLFFSYKSKSPIQLGFISPTHNHHAMGFVVRAQF